MGQWCGGVLKHKKSVSGATVPRYHFHTTELETGIQKAFHFQPYVVLLYSSENVTHLRHLHLDHYGLRANVIMIVSREDVERGGTTRLLPQLRESHKGKTVLERTRHSLFSSSFNSLLIHDLHSFLSIPTTLFALSGSIVVVHPAVLLGPIPGVSGTTTVSTNLLNCRWAPECSLLFFLIISITIIIIVIIIIIKYSNNF